MFLVCIGDRSNFYLLFFAMTDVNSAQSNDTLEQMLLGALIKWYEEGKTTKSPNTWKSITERIKLKYGIADLE